MKNLQRRVTALAAALSLAAPTARADFEAIDTIPWPSLGAFPAYPREEGRPIDAWVHAGVMHDSNVLRTQTNEQSDNIARFGGGMTLDQRVYGRQRVRLDARADYYKYDKSTTLDHWAYALA